MKKTITIDKETTLTISNNASWLMEYREQFGHDIVPDILPIVSAISKLLGTISRNSGKDALEVLSTLPDDVFQDALLELTGMQSVDFINLVWSMSKAADEDIDEPKRWIRQFDTFPLDIIAPAVWDMVLKGFVSSKNQKRLSGTGAKKKSVSTKSSSQGSSAASVLTTSEE